MIKFIRVDDLLPLRNTLLREGKLTNEECRFPSDKLDGAFHLGYYIDLELVCIASFHPQNYGEFNGIGYQLRGMATVEASRKQGLAGQLLNFAMVYLRGRRVNYLWCNARKAALRFYQDTGFEVISEEFVVPGIGPHYAMYAKIC